MVKKLFIAILFVSFLYMSVKALIHLFSNKTILVVSKEHRNITSLPAFSVCENILDTHLGFDKKDLVNGSMILQSFTNFDFWVKLIVDEGNGAVSLTNLNLMDNSKIQSNFHNVTLVDLWTLQCKPFMKGKSYCMPCITFNGAHLKKQSIESVLVILFSFIINLPAKINYRLLIQD